MARVTRLNPVVSTYDAAKKYGQESAMAVRGPAPCATRALAPHNPFGTGGNANLSDGIDTSATYRRWHVPTATATNIRVAYGNFVNNGGFEASGPNNITVRASIELQDGTIIPLFFNGQRSRVIEPGGIAFCDPVGVRIPKGVSNGFWTRTYVSVTAGGKWPRGLVEAHGYRDANNRANAQGGTIGADMTDSGTFTTFSSDQSFAPVAIWGDTAPSTSAIIGGVGDSIMAGYLDTENQDGWLVRALGGNYRYQGVAFSSAKTDDWVTPAKNFRRSPLLAPCTDIVVGLGTNNLGSFSTAHLEKIYAAFAAGGKRLWASTLPPMPTSSDGFATVENQTPNPTNEPNRLAYNAWIRSKPANVYGVIEMADTVESARNSGRWKATGSTNGRYTQDGVHPSTAGAIAAATAFNPVDLFGPPAA